MTSSCIKPDRHNCSGVRPLDGLKNTFEWFLLSAVSKTRTSNDWDAARAERTMRVSASDSAYSTLKPTCDNEVLRSSMKVRSQHMYDT